MDNRENDKLEKLLWSIALPGFGQLLNGQYIKGIVFIALEFLVNVQGGFNEAIVSSFYGNQAAAIQQIDYGWLMFYPCLYCFAAWDAYKEASGKMPPYAFLPFVFAAYFVTVGLIYSPIVRLMGVLVGPIWLPMLFLIPGIGIGLIIRSLLIKVHGKKIIDNK
ncbi:hypothetical protein MUO14_13190 [Halobacillus shinanisalinarum]|uniref:Uncharacterized protein n=1 Tax=Halobacillus shinanisalinarum TaxID=2932258 RepID=A0ABY4GUB1_9BACI|nr:hypothetical protein [Halobacillus shinanisalinarum]UOQ91536.1 hypothetical protein MUO14_13190 [Halobacillus shinanisalinarum]